MSWLIKRRNSKLIFDWADELVDERVDELDGRVDEWVGELFNKQVDEWVNVGAGSMDSVLNSYLIEWKAVHEWIWMN